jgi:hypothetical protein
VKIREIQLLTLAFDFFSKYYTTSRLEKTEEIVKVVRILCVFVIILSSEILRPISPQLHRPLNNRSREVRYPYSTRTLHPSTSDLVLGWDVVCRTVCRQRIGSAF